MAAPPGDASDIEIMATMGFVDMAGYTALTETHGPRMAADLVERFVELVEPSLSEDGHLVDVVGDAGLLTWSEPEAAVRDIARLYRSADEVLQFPALRTGLHHGPVLIRGKRHYGTTVNLTARIASLAAGGEVLASPPIAQAATRTEIEVKDLGLHRLRNLVDPVRVFELSGISSGADQVVDPVCRMRVAAGTASGRLEYGGRVYWFCSLDCAARFTSEPGAFAE